MISHRWGYYIAFHSYTFRIFMHNEFNPINNLNCKPFCDGEEVLRFYDMGDVDVAAVEMELGSPLNYDSELQAAV